jgi:hypothetical protein
LNVCASIIRAGHAVPDGQSASSRLAVLRSRPRNIYAFGSKTAECMLPTSRSLRRRALSVQYMTLEDAPKSRQRGRFTAAPSPSKNICRAEGAARRIDATEISSGCRSGSRGSNRAAESGRTVYRARLRQPHRGRRIRARRLGYIRLTAQRGGVAPSSPSRETPATRRRPLLTGSLSGSFSCSTSCVFRFRSGLPGFFRPCKFDRHRPHSRVMGKVRNACDGHKTRRPAQ